MSLFYLFYPRAGDRRSKDRVVGYSGCGRGKIIGFGLVLPTTGQCRDKVNQALLDLGVT